MFGVAFTCGFSSLVAQRAHQFEFGAFGSFTRYDKVFNLDNQIGGGGRLGYFFSNVVSAELDGGYQSPNPKTGGAAPTLGLGSASLVLNFGTARNLFYILGGYSRLDFEQTAPYRFTDDAIHGAIGDRIFLGDRAALPQTRTMTECPTGATPAPTRLSAPRSMRADAPLTQTATACTTGSTSALVRPPGRASTPRAVRRTRTAMACSTASTSAPARPPARSSTRPVARSTRTKTASRTDWTSVPTRRPGRRWTMSGASASRTRTGTEWTTRRIVARARPPAPAWTPPVARFCSRQSGRR